MPFDNPTSTLGLEMVREVRIAMHDLAESDMTMICVTHEMGFARKVAARILFMADGAILERGNPADFVEDSR